MLITIKPDVNAVSIYICMCICNCISMCNCILYLWTGTASVTVSLCMRIGLLCLWPWLWLTVFAFMTLFVICSKCILWMYLQVCSRSCICICSRISRHSNELTCHIVSNLNRAHLRCTWAQNELEMHLPFRYKGRNGAWHMCVCALAAAVCARSTKWINFFPAYSSAVNSVKVHTFDLFFLLFLFNTPPLATLSTLSLQSLYLLLSLFRSTWLLTVF